MVRKAI